MRLQLILLIALFLTAFLHPFLYLGILFVNGRFDQSQAQVYTSTILRIASGGKGSRSVVVSDPKSPGKEIFLPQGHVFCPQGLNVLPNLPVKMILREGALGFRWVEKAEILTNQGRAL